MRNQVTSLEFHKELVSRSPWSSLNMVVKTNSVGMTILIKRYITSHSGFGISSNVVRACH